MITYEYPTKRTGKNGSGGEESEAILLFASPAPHAQVMGNFRNETAFCNTEGEVDGDEPGKAVCGSNEGTTYLMWGGGVRFGNQDGGVVGLRTTLDGTLNNA